MLHATASLPRFHPASPVETTVSLVHSRETRYTLDVCGVLALLFIAIPAIEIFVLIEVGSALGALPTMGVIIATGIAGAALARSQGLSAMRQLREALAQGRQVGRSLVEAALVLVAAVLMLTPGFLTDGVGLALLVPPLRRILAEIIVVRYAARAVVQVMPGPGQVFGGFAGQRGQPGQRRGPGQERGDSDDEHEPPPPGVIDV
jgi:UPF0716 protein FxsA